MDLSFRFLECSFTAEGGFNIYLQLPSRQFRRGGGFMNWWEIRVPCPCLELAWRVGWFCEMDGVLTRDDCSLVSRGKQ